MADLEIRELRSLHVGPLTLRLDGAECVALWGPSGCGKTLLLRAIADLDPHSGEVLLGGTPQTALSGSEWRRRVAYLPAESHWWSERVEDHFPCPEDRLHGHLDALGLARGCFAWPIERLSSGERQRLALLRLLSRQPAALLLDEPTANLDPEAERAVEEMVGAYRRRQRAPVLWVSHDPEQRQRVAGRTVRLHEHFLGHVAAGDQAGSAGLSPA